MERLHQNGNETGQRVRVAAVVFNAGVTDVRVVKEAESLAAQGYDVRIFGLGKESLELKTESGLPVTVIPRVQVPKTAVLSLSLAAFTLTLLLAFLNGLVLSALGIALITTVLAVPAVVMWPRERRTIQTVGILLTLVLVTAVLAVALVSFAVLRTWYWGRDILPNLALINSIPNQVFWVANLIVALTLSIVLGRLFYILFEAGSEVAGKISMTDKVSAWQGRFGQRLRKKAFCRALADFDPDVVHCHDLPTTIIGLELKRRYGTKFIYDSHELWTEQRNLPPGRRASDATLEKRVMRRADGLITVNESIAKELQRRYASIPEPVIVRNATKALTQPVIYNGCLHRRAGLRPSRRILLFQGGLVEGRGLTKVVEAAADLPDDWSLVFMGSGSQEEELRELAAKVLDQGNQPRERIRFVSPVAHKHLPLWTAGASLGIIPYENISLNNWLCTPNKLWEYPLAGVPILASPFPEMSQVIIDHGTGWLLEDPLTAYSIAELIWNLKSEDLQKARENCGAFIARDNWTLYERRLVALYADLQLERFGREKSSRGAMLQAPSPSAGGST
jgi:glycosyltransferase involved in cell wall biosynthesis